MYRLVLWSYDGPTVKREYKSRASAKRAAKQEAAARGEAVRGYVYGPQGFIVDAL